MDKKVGPYQLGDSLGTLPFGELVIATHAARSEPLAVLLLDDRLAKDHRFRGLLRLQIAVAGGVRHPALARAVEVGDHDGGLYLVVERPTDGRSLGQTVTDGHTLTPEQIIAVIRSLAEGLDTAHGRRLIHGALDPSSVLIAPDGTARLVGMALMGAIDEAGLRNVVAERIPSTFAAPEQREGQRTAATEDRFAFGVLAASLLRVETLAAGPSAAVAAVLDRQRATDPAARYPTCVAFASALAEALTPTAQAAETPAATASPATTLAAPATPAPIAPAPPENRSVTAEPLGRSVTPQSRVPQANPVPDAPPAMPTEPPPPQNRTASPSTPGSTGDTLEMAVPPDLLTPQDAPPAPADVSPQPQPGGGGWLSSIIDPPRPTQFGRPGGRPAPAPGPTGQSQPPAWNPDARTGRLDLNATPLAAGPVPPTPEPEVIVTTVEPTTAMRALLTDRPQRDLIGELIVKGGERVPAIDEVLDRDRPNGKIGRVPIGVVVSGVLALILILAGQALAATIVITIVVVMYGMPKLASMLTASERASFQAQRATGVAHVRRDPGAALPQLHLANGLSFSLTDAEYVLLSRRGQQVMIQLPPRYSTVGDRQTVSESQIAGAMVTYLTPSYLLLDVRQADGTVLHRSPRYAGEPDDVVWSAERAALLGEDGPNPIYEAPVHHEQGAFRAETRSDAGSNVVGAAPPPQRPAPFQQRELLQLPETAQRSLRSAASTARFQTGTLVIGALLTVIVLPWFVGIMGFCAPFFLIAPMAVAAGPIFSRTMKLSSVRHSTAMARLTGSVMLTRNSYGKSARHHVGLMDGTVFKVDQAAYTRLLRAAELRLGSPPIFSFDPNRESPEGYILSQHEIPSATVTFEPTAWLILEVRNPSGAMLYRDSALKEGDLGPHAPRV